MKELRPKTYKNFIGVGNIDEAIRLSIEDPEQGGVTMFTQADNGYIDKTFLFHSRDGRTLKLSGKYHSFWGDYERDILLAVKNGHLMRIITGTTFSESIIRPNVGNFHMEYLTIGNTIYFTNNVIIGAIEDYTARDLRLPAYQYKRRLPAGHLIEQYRGRTYLAKTIGDDHFIIYTDGYNYEHFDERSDKGFFRIPARATMLKAVNDGIYLSCGDTRFLWGTSPEKLQPIKVSDFPAFEGSARSAKDIQIGKNKYKNAVLWTSREGAFIGGDEGFYENLIGSRYKPVIEGMGCGFITQGTINQYISILRN